LASLGDAERPRDHTRDSRSSGMDSRAWLEAAGIQLDPLASAQTGPSRRSSTARVSARLSGKRLKGRHRGNIWSVIATVRERSHD
jgi:hypothetical protein